MAHARTHTTPTALKVLVLGAVMIAIAAIVMFASTAQAQGDGEQDSSTLGLGASQASNSTTLTAADRASATADDSIDDAAEVSETIDPTDGAQRSITVKDPDPVVVPVAVDESNPEAVEKANEVCTLDPLPTAPHVAPDLDDGTWSSGVASAYAIATNDDGNGNFGVTDTASGVDLSDEGITVAVPESQSDLLGRVVEICYDDKVVIATVTDTGGFAQYGRALDLAPGVYKAFGVSSYEEWGTRTVHYRFL